MAEKNQRILITKRMLKEGLLKLLEKKPLDKVNITELCQESGINRTTFYRYYDLPKDILTEMQSDFFKEIFRDFKNPLTISDIERLFLCLSEHAELIKLFFQYNSDADWANIFTNIYSSFPRKKMTYGFQNIDENSTKLLSSYLAGGAFFMVRQWIMEDIPLPPKDVVEMMLNILNKDRIFYCE